MAHVLIAICSLQTRTIAAALIEARRQGLPVIAPKSEEVDALTLEDGYSVQKAMVAWNMMEKGGQQVETFLFQLNTFKSGKQ